MQNDCLYVLDCPLKFASVGTSYFSLCGGGCDIVACVPCNIVAGFDL